MTNNLESTMYDIIPIITKFIIAAGIVMFIMSITIAIHSGVKKKASWAAIKEFLLLTLSGLITIACGALVITLMKYDVDFSSYKFEIPIYLFIGFNIYFVSRLLLHKNDK